MKFTTKDIRLTILFTIIALIIAIPTFIFTVFFNLSPEKGIHGYCSAAMFFGWGLGYFIEIKSKRKS